MENLLNDLRFALRMFGRRPGVAGIVVLSLALGIGANSTIFSLVNGILLRPLPGVARPGELAGLDCRLRGTDFPIGLSYPDYLDVRDGNTAFTGVAAYNQIYASLGAAGRAELVYGYIVTGNYFQLLGAKAELGRVLGPDDDRKRGAQPVAVISHGLWQRRFGSDPAVVGSNVKLNGQPFVIVGVAPRGFIGTEVMFTPDLWVPMAMHQQIVPGAPEPFDKRQERSLRALGRLRPGVGLPQASAQIRLLGERLAREHQDSNAGVSLDVVPESEARLEAGLGNIVNVASTVLLVLAAIVLLIACANVANLLLSQAASRAREVAVRLAVGADRRRLLRQHLTESLLLAAVGGGAGLLLAFWLSTLLSRFRSPTSIPFAFDFSLDHRVLLYTTLISVCAGLIFGLAPALHSTKADLVPALRGDPGAAGTRRRSWLRSTLMIAQVASSLPLLVGAGLFLRSLENAHHIDLGFEPRDVLTFSVDLALHSYSEANGRTFFHRLEERVRGLPGVRSAALGGPVPLDFYAVAKEAAVPGREPGPDKHYPEILYSSVAPGYFQTIGTPLVQGRLFDSRDGEHGARVVVINQAMAKSLWPGRNPVGQQLLVGGAGGEVCEVVGVVKTGKYRILAESPMSYFYRPLEQSYQPKMTLLVKTNGGDPRAVEEEVRRQVQALDEDLPVFDVRELDGLIGGRALMPFKVVTTLASAFGLLGLILAAVGLYGLQSNSVAQRSREIGLRMAMGARPADILRLVLRRGLTLTACGLLIGLTLAFLLSKVMSRLLLDVTSTDPIAFGGVVAMLLAVTTLASYVPARRAIRQDPARTLRHE